MLKIIFYTVLTLGVTGLISIFPSIGLSSGLESDVQFYNQCIEREIYKSQAKVMMLSSRSVILRNYAFIETQKATFYGNEKDNLIEEMVENQVNLKDYQIEYYLNNRFHRWKETLISKIN